MHQVITATYKNGVLKPSQALPLHDQQQVVLVIVPVAAPAPTHRPNSARVATMQTQVDAWLKMQPAEAIRPPVPEKEQLPLAQAVAAMAAEIRTLTVGMPVVDETQLLADIETALAEVQVLSAEETAALDAELQAILAV
jgi:predicted DNA-binding antitoxin AbrB/MazE fold protein